MLKPDMVPENVWCEVALRLEAYRVPVTDLIAKVVAAEVIKSWPGVSRRSGFHDGVAYDQFILPLVQEARK